MTQSITPMNLSDIFDRLFRLMGKTALRNLMIAIIILLPASVILTYGFEKFFSMLRAIIQIAETHDTFPREFFWGMIRTFAMFMGFIAIFMLANLSATVGVTIVSCAEMSGQQISWNEALSKTFSIRLVRAIGQAILEFLAIGCLFIIPVILFGISAGARSGGAISLSVLVILAASAFAIYLWVRWAFALPAIAWEESGVIQSFGRSSFLVKGFWWRTFGILLLLNIIAQFAVSIITTPVQFIALWGFFSKYFGMIGSLANGSVDSFEVLALFDSLGVGLGIVTFVSYVLLLLIVPLISVVMYFDLRARKFEFDEPTNESSEQV